MINVAPRTGDEMTGELARHGVVVRSCRSFGGLSDNYIRVSIGEDWENERFLQVINTL
jgi:histidinol-phosphate aminotransferase